jgi:antitoxin VapB
MNEECFRKQAQLRALLESHSAEAILLRRVSSFAWATCGAASYVNTAVAEGAASLLITRTGQYLVTNNIEAPRLQEEENLQDQGWEWVISPWETPLQGLHRLTAGKNLLSDVPFNGAEDVAPQISRLRAHLSPQEADRFRSLGQRCAESLSAAVQHLRPGMTEWELAALVGRETQQRGVQPIVNLVAVDDRTYRHPLPTAKKLQKYALLVLSGRQNGLVCSISRMVHFGKPPADLQERIYAAAQVNAALLAHSRPGASLAEILHQGKQAYAAAGFPDEWRQHHQGGVTGYEPREYLATSTASDVLAAGQAVAWNPTVLGAKMEDTALVGETACEILTPTPLWNTQRIQIPGMPGDIPCSLALEL